MMTLSQPVPKSGQRHIFLSVCACKQNVEPIFMRMRAIIQVLYRKKRESEHGMPNMNDIHFNSKRQSRNVLQWSVWRFW